MSSAVQNTQCCLGVATAAVQRTGRRSFKLCTCTVYQHHLMLLRKSEHEVNSEQYVKMASSSEVFVPVYQKHCKVSHLRRPVLLKFVIFTLIVELSMYYSEIPLI
jgi:hypothetical protein